MIFMKSKIIEFPLNKVKSRPDRIWFVLDYKKAEDILEQSPAVGLVVKDSCNKKYIISAVDVYNHQVKFINFT